MAIKPLQQLGNLPVDTFLRDYWQQKPVFIKGAFANWQAPLDAGDLAGLAMEDSVESRLLIETPGQHPLTSQWDMAHGPFSEADFAQLDKGPFSLLVQALDQICPEIHDLLNQFRFLPNWRLDDVMASVAPKGGSVGPHFDYYDVFLLQATGTRHWQLGQQCSSASPLQADCPLKILTEFDTQADYTAEPGDLLYIPANIAHWGVAQSDDCTTYSIGFRAPSYQDIMLGVSDAIVDQLTADQRLRDTLQQAVSNPGLVPDTLIQAITQQCQTLFTEERVGQWLGTALTEAKRPAPEVTTQSDWDEEYSEECEAEGRFSFLPSPSVRAAYIVNPDTPDQATVFINGEPWQTSLTLAEDFCGYTDIQFEIIDSDEQLTARSQTYSTQDHDVIQQWITHGYFNSSHHTFDDATGSDKVDD